MAGDNICPNNLTDKPNVTDVFCPQVTSWSLQ